MRRQTRDEYRLWPEAVGALVVALVLVVSAFVAAGAVNRPQDTGPATGSDPVVFLDAPGPVTDAEVVGCLAHARGFARSRDQVQVLYGAHQKSPTDVLPVLALLNGSGEMRVCDAFDSTSVSRTPSPTATPAEPAKAFTNPDTQWAPCHDGRSRLGFTTSWLSVTDPVATGQLRFVVDGEPGPWFTSTAQGGYLHLTAWVEDVAKKSRVRIDQRVLDAAGTTVHDSGIDETSPTQVCGVKIF